MNFKNTALIVFSLLGNTLSCYSMQENNDEKDITFQLGKVIINGNEITNFTDSPFLVSISPDPQIIFENRTTSAKLTKDDNFTQTFKAKGIKEIMFFSDQKLINSSPPFEENLFYCSARNIILPKGHYSKVFIDIDIKYNDKNKRHSTLNVGSAECTFTVKPIVKSLKQITIEKIKELNKNEQPYLNKEYQKNLPQELQNQLDN